jgi:hypothetical protein
MAFTLLPTCHTKITSKNIYELPTKSMFRQYTHKIQPQNNEYTQLSCEHKTNVKSGTSHASPTTNGTTVL